MIQPPIRVLVVDDESEVCILTKHFLEMSKELEVDTVCSAAEAMAALSRKRYDVIVSDYQMPGTDGIQFLKSLRAARDGTPFILFTGKGREEVVIEALNSGADSYLQKGGKALPQYAELENAILGAVQRHRAMEALLESEARFEQLTEYGGIVIWDIDADGLFTYVSGASDAVWGGYRPEELVGKRYFYELTPESDRESFRVVAFEKMKRKERFVNLENPMITKDGRVIWVSTNGIPMLNADGTLRGYRGSDIDITERKRTEEALRASQQIIEGIINAIPVRVFWKDKNLVYMGCNSIFARDAGFTDPKEVIGKDDYQMVWREQAEQYRSDDHHVIESGRSKSLIEEPQSTPDGGVITLLTSKMPLHDAKGEIIGVLGTYMDITERKKAEIELQTSKKELADIIDFLPDATFVVDLEGKVVAWNKAIEKMTGVSKQGMIGRGNKAYSIPFYGYRRNMLVDRLAPDDKVIKTRHDNVIRKGSTLFAEAFCSALNKGKGAQVWATATSLFDEKGNRVGTIESIRDITERKNANVALRKSEKEYRQLVESASEAIVVAQDGMLRLVNPMAVAVTGFSEKELLSKPFPSLIHPDDRAMVVERYQRRSKGEDIPSRYAFRLLSKDGSTKWVEINAVGIDWEERPGTLNFLTDITERKRAEEALLESEQKFRSLFEHMLDGLAYCRMEYDDQGRPADFVYLDVNSAFESLTGLRYAVGRRVTEVIPGIKESSPELFEVYGRVALTGKSEEFETHIKPLGIWLRISVFSPERGHFVAVFENITERKKLDHQIKERMKELRAFYSLAEMAEREDMALDDLYQELTNVLPKSWQYPEITCAKIVIDSREFHTENFAESEWRLTTPIKVNGLIAGRIEVGYLEERAELDIGPFMKEERRLIDAIAERVGHITGRKRIENALRQANNKLGILSTITRHDINNQMMIVNGFLELCKSREKDPDLSKYLDKMSHAAAYVQEQIGFTKDYQELGIHVPTWSCAGRRITEAFNQLHFTGVVLEDKTNGMEILADPMVGKVFYNLIDNSIRHGGHVTCIKLSSERVGDSLSIAYEDDGAGISLVDKTRLFEKGFGKNTGYGLFLIREILAITGITIEERGQAGKGVRFEMLVPPGAWRTKPSG